MKRGRETVSVIIPNYNQRRYLPQRFESIFRQTHKELELLFLDDASSDESVHYANRVSGPFPLQIAATSKNTGSPFYQWKKGLEQTRSDFVWIAESDDSCDPTLIERLLEQANRHPNAGMVYAQSVIIDANGNEIESFLKYTDEIDPAHWRKNHVSEGRGEAENYLVIRNTIPNVSGCLFRRGALTEALMDPIQLRMCGDWLIYARICRHHDIAFVAEPLNQFRRHPDSVRARTGPNLRICEEYEVLGYIKDHFELTAEKHEASCRRHYSLLINEMERKAGSREFDDIERVISTAEKFDPLIRLRLLPKGPDGNARLTVAAKYNQQKRGAVREMSLPEGEWIKIRLGPFAGPPVVNPLGRRGLIAIRKIQFTRAESETSSKEAGTNCDLREISLGSEVHRISSDDALELFASGPQSKLNVRLPAFIDVKQPYYLDMEVRVTSREECSFKNSNHRVGVGRTDNSAIRRRAVFLLPSLELGGADRVNLDLIETLKNRHSWEITVVTTKRSDDPWSGEFLAVCPDLFRLHRFLKWPEYLDFIEQLLISRRPDVLFLSNSLLGYRLLPWIRMRFPRISIVDLVHLVTEGWHSGGYPRISIENQSYLERTFVVSDDLREWLTKNGREESKVAVCFAPVDTSKWIRSSAAARQARSRWGLEHDTPVLLFAARFCDQKQPRLLLAIVSGLVARKLSFLLLLAGDGPDRDWLEQNLCKRYPLHTRMLGALHHDEIRLLMSATHLLLLPSKEEGVALVLYEAMSMEVVPVATDVGGQKEIVTPDCGILLKNGPSLATEMVSEIEKLLYDPERRDHMAKAARVRAEQMNLRGNIGDQMESLLRGVLEGKKNTSVSLPLSSFTEVTGNANEAIKLTLSEELGAEAWAKAFREGRRVPNFISKLARHARSIPFFGSQVSKIERRYGERLGNLVARWL